MLAGDKPGRDQRGTRPDETSGGHARTRPAGDTSGRDQRGTSPRATATHSVGGWLWRGGRAAAGVHHDSLDVRELPDAPLAELAAVAAPLDAAERHSWV